MTARTTMQVREQRKGEVRSMIGMTMATLALLGGVVLWQVRPSSEAAAVRPVESAPVNDQEMYGQWQQRTAIGSRSVDSAAVSDEEMYRRVRALTTRVDADHAAVSDQEMFQRSRWVAATVQSEPAFDAPHDIP
jgi:hypothetical protein